jgi:hypothetical protein
MMEERDSVGASVRKEGVRESDPIVSDIAATVIDRMIR